MGGNEDEDCGIFWSNDRKTQIGEMARSIGVLELEEEMGGRVSSNAEHFSCGASLPAKTFFLCSPCQTGMLSEEVRRKIDMLFQTNP